MLAETTTTEFSKKINPKTFNENKNVAVKGGNIAGNTRKNIEKELGTSVVTKENYLDKTSEKRKPLKKIL